MKGATNHASMKNDNRKLILDILRKNPMSRAGLAAASGLTRASITLIVNDLLAKGLVEERETQHRAFGRSPVLLGLTPNARYLIGINIKRTQVEVGLVDLQGAVAAEDRFDIRGTAPKDVLAKALAYADAQIAERSIARRQVLGIGVCAPGPVDYRRGVILNPPHFSAWHHVHVEGLLKEKTELPVLLENVSGALALEVKYYAEIEHPDHFIAVLIDSGVGSGIVLDGKLFHGAGGHASELGHITVEHEGLPCDCGNFGCLERYIAVPALLKGSPFASWRDVMLAPDTDQAACSLRSRMAGYLSDAIVTVLNLFDLRQVVLMGDAADCPGRLIALLTERIGARMLQRDIPSQGMITSSRFPCGVRTAAMPLMHAVFQNDFDAFSFDML